MGRAITCEEALICEELRRGLWRRFTRSIHALQRRSPNRDGRYIGINEGSGESNVLFRLERRRPERHAAVALYVTPAIDADGGLVFGVRAVIVVNGAVTGRPTTAVPVFYDARLDRFTISTPPIEVEHMAAFFLQRVAGLLDTVANPEPRECTTNGERHDRSPEIRAPRLPV